MILYAISDRRLAENGDLITHAARIIEGGVDWFQLREKDLSDRMLFELLAKLCAIPRSPGSRILMNGRADLASAAGADGVHLTSSSPSTETVRRAFPRPFLILRSCHHPSEVIRAAHEGADAVTFGPVYATPSKARYGPPVGTESLREACDSVEIPVLALGGIDENNAAETLDCGAEGVAAIRLFWKMENPAARITALRGRLCGNRP